MRASKTRAGHRTGKVRWPFSQRCGSTEINSGIGHLAPAFSYLRQLKRGTWRKGNPTNRQRDGVVRYQSIRYYGPFPSRLRADRVLQPDFLKLPRLRRILSVLAAGRQRIRSTRKQISGQWSSFVQSILVLSPLGNLVM